MNTILDIKWPTIKHTARTYAISAIYMTILTTSGYLMYKHTIARNRELELSSPTIESTQQQILATNNTIQFLWTVYSDESNSIRGYNYPVPPDDTYYLSRNDAIVTCAHSDVFSWTTSPMFAVNEHLTYGSFERVPETDPPTARFSTQPIIPLEYRPAIDTSVPIAVRINNLGLQIAVAQIRANGEFHIGAADPKRASLDFENTFAIRVEPFVIHWRAM